MCEVRRRWRGERGALMARVECKSAIVIASSCEAGKRNIEKVGPGWRNGVVLKSAE
jgi:hypothetical protein